MYGKGFGSSSASDYDLNFFCNGGSDPIEISLIRVNSSRALAIELILPSDCTDERLQLNLEYKGLGYPSSNVDIGKFMKVSTSNLDVTYSPKVGSSVTMTGENFLSPYYRSISNNEYTMVLSWTSSDDGASTVNTTISIGCDSISSAVPCLDISDDGTTSKIVIPNIDLTSAQGTITAYLTYYAPALANQTTYDPYNQLGDKYVTIELSQTLGYLLVLPSSSTLQGVAANKNQTVILLSEGFVDSNATLYAATFKCGDVDLSSTTYFASTRNTINSSMYSITYDNVDFTGCAVMSNVTATVVYNSLMTSNTIDVATIATVTDTGATQSVLASSSAQVVITGYGFAYVLISFSPYVECVSLDPVFRLHTLSFVYFFPFTKNHIHTQPCSSLFKNSLEHTHTHTHTHTIYTTLTGTNRRF